MTSLKQFIRNVRGAKTIADERAVIQKESAAIRASFREESADSGVRRNNVAKLLYLFTLGERTHFGQIECLKLLASPRFADKRLGYLGTMLLLDENQEVLTLVTNSLKNDLNHTNQYVVGLALCALGNIASIEMSRDLFSEVEDLITAGNPYIRRKAALCAMRICRKVPDLQEHFWEKAKTLLSDRNHGVLLCGLTLVTSLCEADEAEGGEQGVVEIFRPLAAGLVRTLKGLAGSGYAPEHDVTGITDPFLQVKILQLLRVLGRGDAPTSEQINDILAQVATNTDASKNVGNSILYEAVLTILDIEADSGLRVLGVNILGKFLANKDNNIRYVALNTLVKVVAVEPNAVQRHRSTILECLRDPDISIRRRALDLSFTLINESNVRVLIRELLAFLEVADNEFKPSMTSQIGIAADRFSPNKRWHIDTMLRVLKLAGHYVKEQILSSFVRLIATTPDLQTYSAQKLYASLKADITQEGLTLAGAWVIGEYGDSLIRGGQYEEEELVQAIVEGDLVDLLSTILSSSYATQSVSEYIVTALIKLSTRLTEPGQIDRIRRLLHAHTTSLDVEIQQRAVEYGNLFGYDTVRRGVLERMPAPEIGEAQRVLGEATPKRKAAEKKKKAGGSKTTAAPSSEQEMLLDLMGDHPAAAGVGGVGAHATGSESGSEMHQLSNADLLADILGGSDSPGAASSPRSAPAAATSTAARSSTSSSSAILDLFDSPAPAPAPPPAAAPTGPRSLSSSSSTHHTAGSHEAYDRNGLHLTIQLQRPSSTSSDLRGETITHVLARFEYTRPAADSSSSSITHLNLQAAVPRAQKLQMNAISRTELRLEEAAAVGMGVGAGAGAGGSAATATQAMRVIGSKAPPLKLRLRISYTIVRGQAGVGVGAGAKEGEEEQVVDQVDWVEAR
ncbi:MAG: clathrin associated protein complex large subunit [Phylliscum demangeonii]|nr:MAG: clathrin associated protein complex large subunit [Phylliscum demangeonii]